MSKENKIDEMCYIVCHTSNPNMTNVCKECRFDKMCDIQEGCKALYNAGYRKQSGWISVDERLPESATHVLIYSKYKLPRVASYYRSETNHEFDGFYAECIKWEATHWMPLPDAPEEGENNND